MIIDFEKQEPDLSSPFDVAVVGGGPAGISACLELEKFGLKVCLIESGSSSIRKRHQRLNQVRNVGIGYKDLSVQRARYLGGTSNFWGGNCIPFDPVDFEFRAIRNGPGWPFPLSQLDSYTRQAESLLGIDFCSFGPSLMDFLDVKDDPDGSEFEWKAWKFCEFPFRFGERFYHALSDSDRIVTLLNANWVGFEFQRNGQRAKSALIRSLQGKSATVKAKCFVLACGGVENARLLLNLQGQGQALSEHQCIGRGFAEHPNATIGFLHGKDAGKVYESHKIRYFEESREIKPGIGLSRRAQVNHGLLNGIVSVWPVPLQNSVVTRAKLLLHLLRKKEFGIHFLLNFFMVLPGIVSLLPHVRHRLRGKAVETPQHANRFEVRLMTETCVNPDSRVVLTDEVDAVGLKVASLDWQLTEKDREIFMSTSKLAKHHFESTGDVELSLAKWIEQDSKDWFNQINTDGHYGHHMGTTRMGSGPEDSVVDENCRVHGVENLYVAGSSVFPAFGFANPTLSIVAMSLRLAAHLKQSLDISEVDAA